MHVDTLITNAKIADLFRLRLFDGWLGIRGNRFVLVEAGDPPAELTADHVHDANGRYLLPTLIDAHMHIELSLITPRRFAEAVLPFGTTAVLADPHEIANVAGVEGIRWMIEASQDILLRVFIAIPSCVPATSPNIEWTAHVFDADAIQELFDAPNVIALGEVMDYRGLLGQNDRLPELVRVSREAGLRLEGHIPTLSGVELSEYLSHGISSDHTLTFPAKILEQISKGVTVMLQTKSITPENMAVVADLPDRSGIVLVTDDIEPPLLQDGHLSRMVTMAIDAGLDPLEAYASASLRAARYLNLRDMGAIAPGYRADFMLLDDLTAFPPNGVFVDGQCVATEGNLIVKPTATLPPLPPSPPVPSVPYAEMLRLDRDDDPASEVVANVVVLENKHNTLTSLQQQPIALINGYAVFEEGDELNLVAVIARDGANSAVGLIKNTGIQQGAFASSLAHDSHNLLLIGRDVRSMIAAAQAVQRQGGGIAVARDTGVLATLPLPLFGLISDEPAVSVARDLTAVENTLRELGMDHQRPFLTLSIMALSVSPFYKFSDQGIVDTEQRTLLPTWEIAPHA